MRNAECGLRNDNPVPEALADFEESVKGAHELTRATYFNNRGFVLFRLGKTKDAIKAYDKAIALDSTFKLALNNLHNAYAQLDPHKANGPENVPNGICFRS